MRRLAFAVGLLVGCDRAFGLDGRVPLDGPPDGTPDVQGDTDGDTLRDDVDNCPAIANFDQHDEDHDDVGDVCDSCPHVANASQDNTDGDTLGEACDDSAAIDCLVRFDPFTGPIPPPASKGTWILEDGDAVVQTDPAITDAYVLVDTSQRDNPLIITHARVTQTGDPANFSNVGVWGEASVAETNVGVPDVGFVAEVGRTISFAPTDNTTAGLHVGKRVSPTMASDSQFPPFSPIQAVTVGTAVDLRLDMRGGGTIRSSARLDGGLELLVPTTTTPLPAGRIGFRTFRMAAAFDYVVIVVRRSTLPCPERD